RLGPDSERGGRAPADLPEGQQERRNRQGHDQHGHIVQRSPRLSDPEEERNGDQPDQRRTHSDVSGDRSPPHDAPGSRRHWRPHPARCASRATRVRMRLTPNAAATTNETTPALRSAPSPLLGPTASSSIPCASSATPTTPNSADPAAASRPGGSRSEARRR